MNVMGLREARTKLTALGKQSQKGKAALVTRRGRPFFVVVGVEGEKEPERWRIDLAG